MICRLLFIRKLLEVGTYSPDQQGRQNSSGRVRRSVNEERETKQ